LTGYIPRPENSALPQAAEVEGAAEAVVGEAVVVGEEARVAGR
jgi:hypothetical protein